METELLRCIECSCLFTEQEERDHYPGFGLCPTHRRWHALGYYASKPCPFGPKSKAAALHRERAIDILWGQARRTLLDHVYGGGNDGFDSYQHVLRYLEVA